MTILGRDELSYLPLLDIFTPKNIKNNYSGLLRYIFFKLKVSFCREYENFNKLKETIKECSSILVEKYFFFLIYL